MLPHSLETIVTRSPDMITKHAPDEKIYKYIFFKKDTIRVESRSAYQLNINL